MKRKELKPLFKRYWRITLESGEQISQFDEHGNYVLWSDKYKPVKIEVLPFTKEFSDIVNKAGNNSVVVDLPVLSFDIDSSVVYHRNCTIRYVPNTTCKFCGTILVEGSKAICPKCFARNWYYCDRCDKLIDTPKVVDKKILCPDCDEPRGLIYVECVAEIGEQKLQHYHVLDIDNQKHIILDLIRCNHGTRDR